MTQKDVIAQATALHERGAIAEARRLYESVLAAEPDNAEALHGFGVLLLQAGKPEKALQLMQAAAEQNIGSAVMVCDLATALNAAGKTGAAMAAYERALALEPNLAEAHYGLGAILFS